MVWVTVTGPQITVPGLPGFAVDAGGCGATPTGDLVGATATGVGGTCVGEAPVMGPVDWVALPRKLVNVQPASTIVAAATAANSPEAGRRMAITSSLAMGLGLSAEPAVRWATCPDMMNRCGWIRFRPRLRRLDRFASRWLQNTHPPMMTAGRMARLRLGHTSRLAERSSSDRATIATVPAESIRLPALSRPPPVSRSRPCRPPPGANWIRGGVGRRPGRSFG